MEDNVKAEISLKMLADGKCHIKVAGTAESIISLLYESFDVNEVFEKMVVMAIGHMIMMDASENLAELLQPTQN